MIKYLKTKNCKLNWSNLKKDILKSNKITEKNSEKKIKFPKKIKN